MGAATDVGKSFMNKRNKTGPRGTPEVTFHQRETLSTKLSGQVLVTPCKHRLVNQRTHKYSIPAVDFALEFVFLLFQLA